MFGLLSMTKFNIYMIFLVVGQVKFKIFRRINASVAYTYFVISSFNRYFLLDNQGSTVSPTLSLKHMSFEFIFITCFIFFF